MEQHTERFIGRAVVIDPATGQDSEYSAYVCVLLTGKVRQPSVTVCEAADVDALLRKLLADELFAKFKNAKISYDPPPDAYYISGSMCRQRYRALPYHELNRAQTVLSGR